MSKKDNYSVDLTAKPFNLDEPAINWVENTLKGMTLEQKIGQLFCVTGMSTQKEDMEPLVKDLEIGGIMFRPTPGKEVQEAHRFLQSNSKIPLLTAANLEAGGNGVALDGTEFAKPMQVGATAKGEHGYRLGKIACSEGAAVGCNWAFAPIVDIDMNFRNPITNLRTFGDNKDLVLEMAKGYLTAADEENVAVSIKHFPGDGVDERDHHLLTSVNSLSVEEWDNTFGEVYSQLIDHGAKTVMVGHIMLPEYSRLLRPEITDQEILPASLSEEILNDLLRDKLGFNGLIVTDATLMVGFTVAMPRKDAVPAAIANGCDMFLFTKNMKEDFNYMLQGYHNGVLTEGRLNQAVTRILATKASLDLHTKHADGSIVPQADALEHLANPTHKQWAKEVADESITLVKDTQNLLPLDPKKHKRVYLNVLEESTTEDSITVKRFKKALENEGFEVTVRNRDVRLNMGKVAGGEELTQDELALMGELVEGVDDFASKYDLVIYVANYETASNNTVVRLSWQVALGMGNDFPWFVKEVPTLFISMANPYHLLDVPMMKTFINAYTSTQHSTDAVIEKIMGRSEFKGVNPVDPFCGKWDTRL